MDRRAALKKLGVGGAIAAGGSIVLSSTNVAYAMSGGTPPSGGWIVTQTGNGSKVTFTLNLDPTNCTYASAQGTILSPAGTFDGFAASNPQFTVEAKKTGQNKWTPGEQVTARITVQYTDCADGVYTNTYTYQ